MDRLVRGRCWTAYLSVILLGVLAPPIAAAETRSAGSFEVPAWAFDRGNAKTFTVEYADGGPMVAYGGQSPVVVEYDIPVPVAASYSLWIRYTAADPRPVEMALDGKRAGECCKGSTGSWNTSGAQWELAGTFRLAQGKHTLKLERPGAFPHVMALRFDSPVAFPQGWTLDRPKARKLDSPPPVLASDDPRDVRPDALRLAITDLAETFGTRYPKGREWLRQLDELGQAHDRCRAEAAKGIAGAGEKLKRTEESLAALRNEALLANPLLDFDRLLLVRRGGRAPNLGLPMNWQSNSCLPKNGYDDEIAVLSPVRPEGRLQTLFKPDGGQFVGDVDLDFGAERMLFSMPGENRRWQVFEIRADGSGLRQLTGEQPDVDSYDACYLPNGKVLFTCTAPFVGVPCVYGSSHVATLYVMDADGKNIRQLCFDQEHDWCPVVLNSGRVLYLRWEYTDTPHSNTRLLFHMNPDGTEQMEYCGSNSYWPNSTFYARPIPGHPTKVVGVIGGHHDNPRMGELVIFDPARGRREAQPAVQRIPGYGKKVEPIIRDGLTAASWPKFLHPYPLSEKYFLVASKPTPQAAWGIYLVDVFDNFVLLKELAGSALLEPIPLRPTPRPPVVPEKVNLASKDALVYLPDIYQGDGLKGIPRGKVKAMRLFTYHFSYQGMGGLLGVLGMDGPWDIKRVLGTVPVCEDGSARFKIPANTPISLQPLDEEGKALQLMRSWMTAMPGEVVQCAGCHEPQNTAPANKITLALGRPVAEIAPWRGPTRGFSYAREVQPVIDKYCLACHNGQPRQDGPIADLRGDVKLKDWSSVAPGNGGGAAGKFSVGYAELHRYVRRPGIESDYHMLEPMEFHADTTHLVQMLRKGHYNVQLDGEAWDRLITWIDLNCPYHGTWGEEVANPGAQRQRRRELLKRYANVDDDPEAVPLMPTAKATPIQPPAAPNAVAAGQCPGWPFDPAEAQRRQAATGLPRQRALGLAEGIEIRLSLVPPGEFIMGSHAGEPDERPQAKVKIDRPFWMAQHEVTNEVYALFDPHHDSRVEDKNTYQFGIHGYPSNRPEQPVVRVSWQEAMAYCQWLSAKTGAQFTLPTEAQWEWACRAGAATPFSFGPADTDFSAFANLSDAKMSEFASNPYTVDVPLANPTKYDDWIPKEARFNDQALLAVRPGSYLANAWGLFDMHGNVAEWTRSVYRAMPYDPAAGRDDPKAAGRRVVRGGSWRDTPRRSTASFRLAYEPYQHVYNVGFRVIAQIDPPALSISGN